MGRPSNLSTVVPVEKCLQANERSAGTKIVVLSIYLNAVRTGMSPIGESAVLSGLPRSSLDVPSQKAVSWSPGEPGRKNLNRSSTNSGIACGL